MIYEVVLTYNCNWDCLYCSVDTHNNKLSEEDALKKLDIPESGSTVILSGGEIGLLSEEFLRKVITILVRKKCIIHVNTNGLFLRRYPHLLRYMLKINYHCSDNLDAEVEFPRVEHFNVDYCLVVHDENVSELGGFLDKNDDIEFTVIPSTNPSTGIQGAPVLGWDSRFYILKKYGKRLTEDGQRFLILGRDYSGVSYL